MTSACYDVVVVGAGVAGASLGLQLARQNLKVALVEQGVAGAGGATALSGGIVRVYDPDPVLARLSEAGRSLLLNWQQLGMRSPSPYSRSGAFWLRPQQETPAATHIHVGNIRDFPQLGFLGARADNPQVLYEADSGYVDPRRLCAAMVSEAQAQGMDLFENTPVSGFQRLADQTLKVNTSGGNLSAARVALCTGAGLIDTHGEAVGYARAIPLVTVHVEGIVLDAPLIDESASTYLRPLRAGTFFCGAQKWSEPGQPVDHKQVCDDALARLRTVLGYDAAIDVINVGQKFDAYTGDFHPVSRFVEDDQVFLLGGFSGRGVKYALAIGVSAARALVASLGRTWRYSLWDDCLAHVEFEGELSCVQKEANLA